MFKALSVFMVGCLISFVFLVNFDSHSWFTSHVESNFAVTSATQDDIIESITITKHPSRISKEIITVVTTDIANPEIHFEVKGEIYKYVQHINPIKASDYDGNEGKANINLKVSYSQLLQLLSGNPCKDVITGKIVVRAFNGYIIDERNIEISKRRLLRVFVSQMPTRRTRTQATSDNLPITEDEITDIMAYLAGQVSWQAPQEKSLTTSTEMRLSSKDEANLQSSDMKNVGPQPPEELGIPINKLQLSENQQIIINTVAPTLQNYLNETYSMIVDLVSQINENNQSIYQLELIKEDLEGANAELRSLIGELSVANEQLKSEIEELINSYQELNLLYKDLTAERDKLDSDYAKLMADKNKLDEDYANLLTEKNNLEADYEALAVEKSNLEETHTKLVEENDKLNEDYKDLKEENTKLTDTNIALHKRIDELRDSNSSLRTQINRLNSQLASSQDTISSQNQTIVTQQQEIDRLNALVETLQQELDSHNDDSGNEGDSDDSGNEGDSNDSSSTGAVTGSLDVIEPKPSDQSAEEDEGDEE